MAVKKGSLKAAAASATAECSSENGRSFQLSNSTYSQEEILPWSKTENGTVGAAGICGGEEQSDFSRGGDATTDPDMLFSPLNNGESDEEDEYDKGYLSPFYFGAQYPKRFHHGSVQAKTGAVEQHNRSGSSCSMPSSELLGINEDFWKEVALTQEESICYTPETALGDVQRAQADAQAGIQPESQGEATCADTSFEEYITEDLDISTATGPDSTNWNQDFKIKLLCYRDGKGNFRLKTEEDIKNNHGGNAVTKTSIKKLKKNRDKKLLKRALRRKSGVWEMVNTGVGIREFML